MNGKTKGEITRARVLETARALINAKGFNNTSINDIIEATGVKKGNLYFHFNGKEELGLAILEEAKSDFFLFLSKSLKGQGPLERLFSFFDAVFAKHKEMNFVGGCLFGNTALEMSDKNCRFSDCIHEVFSEWTAIIADLLMEAREAGELKLKMSPELLAKHIVATIEGGIMFSRVSKHEDDLRDCLNSMRILLEM
ncbi:MAG: TetR/AcrR family transcriptional regulator [Candidatus Tectomicrobia bacterium]|uniref:TetR/AcrR family transcriptional regulator n=1 Tax=Tectimicrobiota bacterium TaxID=2528274 RepID=A0A933GLN2_UNCTE|nr:TetR/AcrR family transcriptional regulator [Candidatus Tectomicrobia bacterium]